MKKYLYIAASICLTIIIHGHILGMDSNITESKYIYAKHALQRCEERGIDEAFIDKVLSSRSAVINKHISDTLRFESPEGCVITNFLERYVITAWKHHTPPLYTAELIREKKIYAMNKTYTATLNAVLHMKKFGLSGCDVAHIIDHGSITQPVFTIYHYDDYKVFTDEENKKIVIIRSYRHYT